MSSIYTGNPSTFTPGTGLAATITVPSDGDALSAASANLALDKLADLVAALTAPGVAAASSRRLIVPAAKALAFGTWALPPFTTPLFTAPWTAPYMASSAAFNNGFAFLVDLPQFSSVDSVGLLCSTGSATFIAPFNARVYWLDVTGAGGRVLDTGATNSPGTGLAFGSSGARQFALSGSNAVNPAGEPLFVGLQGVLWSDTTSQIKIYGLDITYHATVGR